jgi:hypothetical protein
LWWGRNNHPSSESADGAQHAGTDVVLVDVRPPKFRSYSVYGSPQRIPLSLSTICAGALRLTTRDERLAVQAQAPDLDLGLVELGA